MNAATAVRDEWQAYWECKQATRVVRKQETAGVSFHRSARRTSECVQLDQRRPNIYFYIKGQKCIWMKGNGPEINVDFM